MKPKTSPILDSLWQTKAALAREAGGEVARLREISRCWEADHPHSGPRVKDGAALRAWLASQEEADVCVIREDPPPPAERN